MNFDINLSPIGLVAFIIFYKKNMMHRKRNEELNYQH